MSRADILSFHAATPIWFWPVLMWNLYWMLRYLDRRAEDETFLVRIHTDGRGGLYLEWIATPERPLPWELSDKISAHELFNRKRRAITLVV